MNNLVSVIVPIYNVEDYLLTCIKSILNQTYTNIEVILVNDGSTDKSLDICKKIIRNDSRVRLISKKNGGLSEARNFGIDEALGEYYLFVDSDDYIKEDMIEKMVIAMNKERNIDLVICNYTSEGDFKNEDNKSFRWTQNDFWKNYYGPNYVACVVAWNKLYKKELFNNLRYKIGKLNEDEFIIQYIIEQCRSITFLNDQLYFYRLRKNSITHSTNMEKAADQVDAFLERINYFYKHNQKHLLNKSVNAEIYLISNLIYFAQNKNDSKKALKYRDKFLKTIKTISNNYLNIWMVMKIILLKRNPKFIKELSDFKDSLKSYGHKLKLNFKK